MAKSDLTEIKTKTAIQFFKRRSLVLGDRKYYGKRRRHCRHYLSTVEDVCKWELLVDHAMMRCIKATVTNDVQYFIFEDVIYQVGFERRKLRFLK